MIRILLVDDQNLVQQGIKSLLAQDPELKIVGTLKDGRSAVRKIAELTPDVVLLDIEMPGMDGITATKYITHLAPQTKVIILSSHEDKKYLTQALMAGAKAYLLKDSLIADLKQSIFAVDNGYSQIESRLLAKIFDPSQIKAKNQQKTKRRSLNVDVQTTQAVVSEQPDLVVVGQSKGKKQQTRSNTLSVPKIHLPDADLPLEKTIDSIPEASSRKPREAADETPKSNQLSPTLVVQDSGLQLSTTESSWLVTTKRDNYAQTVAQSVAQFWQTKILSFKPLINRWLPQLIQFKSRLLALLKRSWQKGWLTKAGLVGLGLLTVIIIHQIFS